MRAADPPPGDTRKKPGPNELRDHLANERTFLSWVRTVITVTALGFVVARFGLVAREIGGRHVDAGTAREGAVIGVALVIGGAVMTLLATGKFLQTRRDIERDVVHFSPTLDIALSLVVTLGSIGLAAYLIVTS